MTPLTKMDVSFNGNLYKQMFKLQMVIYLIPAGKVSYYFPSIYMEVKGQVKLADGHCCASLQTEKGHTRQ